MTNRFMISVAAVALIAGTGFANAQGTMSREGSSAGSTAQQSAPSSAGTSWPRSQAKPTQAVVGHEVHPVRTEVADRRQERACRGQLQGQKSKNMSSDNDRPRAARR